MARVELPESRLRLRKRRRRVRLSLLLLCAALLALAAVAGAAHLSAVRVSEVAVSGAQTLSVGAVESFVRQQLEGSYGYVLPKDNIFLYPKARIRQELLAAYPVLASADVHARDFHTIAVVLVERAPRALWCPEPPHSADCLFIDERGVAYGEAPSFSEPVYTVYGGPLPEGPLPKQFLSEDEFQALSALVDAVVQKLSGEKLQDVLVDAQGDVHMRFTDGFVLKFALREQGGDVFERLTLALTAEPLASRTLAQFEYLDLRFGDKLYYKLRD